MKKRLGVLGMGIVTDALGHVSELLPARVDCSLAGRIDPGAIAAQDVLSQLGLSALHQAWTMAEMAKVPGEAIALIVQSAWGNVDSTVAYLESMLEAEGRYASPRHFSRSVYSSAASVAAIHFGIRGPCETLVFAQQSVGSVLRQAWRMLAAGRCERVATLWVDQGGEIAADLAQRAAEKLHRREFTKYGDAGLGYGAVALVLGRGTALELDAWDEEAMTRRAEGREGKRFALEGAVELLRALI